MARRWPVFFDSSWYLAVYPDVAAAGRNARRHYLRHGRHEGRWPTALRAVWHERDLRWGLLDGALTRLHDLAQTATGAEAVWARLACARAAVRDDDWHTAADWLAPLDPDQDIVRGFALPDPALLAIEVAIATQDVPRATQICAAARRWFGKTPDIRLAHANLRALTHGHDAAWQRIMAGVFRTRGLSGLCVTLGDSSGSPSGNPSGESPAFDRLGPAAGLWTSRKSGPLVSVIVPARDCADTLPTALRSLCQQTHQTLEIIVVENGSTDATASVAARWATAHPGRIRVLRAPDAASAYDARNLGMATATGAYVTVLDADDWAHPQRITRQVATLRRTPKAAATICDWVRVTSDLQFRRWWKDDGLIHPDISSLMIRQEARTALGFWDRVRVGADTEYHDRLRARFGADAVPPTAAGVPLGLGRLRPESLTGRAETSIQSHIYGDRRSYTRAAQRWHAQGGGQHLPAHPQIRPFAAPPSLSIGAPTTPCATALVAGPDRMLDAGLFDDLWYMTTYPDLRAQDVDGVRHYWHHGAGEGRDPSAVFSTSGYARDHGISLADVPRHALAAGVVQYLPDWAGNRVGQHPKQPHIIVFGHKAGAEIFGAERVLLQVLDRAHLAGVRVSVVLPHSLSDSYHTAVLARCDRLFVRPYGWHFDGVAPPVATVQRLAALIEQTGADVVHQMTSVLSAPLCAAKAAGVPSVVHVHELPQQDPRLCYDMGTTPDALRGHLLRWADTCVAVSPAVAQWLDAPGRTQNWHNAVDTDLADLPTPAPHGRPLRVALIGSLTARKGIADYRALAQQSKRDGIDYVMIGPMTADLEALPRWPAVLHHAGYADTPTTALAQADIVVNLSLFEESHGLTIHEALVAGRPVVVYDQPALRNLIGDSGAGIIVPPRDITALRRAILRLRDPASFAAASQAARIRGATLQARAQNQGDALFRTPPRC